MSCSSSELEIMLCVDCWRNSFSRVHHKFNKTVANANHNILTSVSLSLCITPRFISFMYTEASAIFIWLTSISLTRSSGGRRQQEIPITGKIHGSIKKQRESLTIAILISLLNSRLLIDRPLHGIPRLDVCTKASDDDDDDDGEASESIFHRQ